MAGLPTVQRWLQDDDGGNWHAFFEGSSETFCGERIVFSSSIMADSIPAGGKAHGQCQKIVDKELADQAAAEGAVETSLPESVGASKPRRRTSKPA